MEISDLNLASHDYQTPEVILLPYKAHRFPPTFLHSLHAQLELEGTLKTLFAGVSGIENVENFIRILTPRPVVIYIIKPDRVVGFGWITESEGIDGARKAAFGFAFFRQAWGTKLVRDLCWLSLRWWFEELKITILYATMLKTNRMALNFSRNFGFTFLCYLPWFFREDKVLVDATLICLPGPQFSPLFSEWREKNPVGETSLAAIDS